MHYTAIACLDDLTRDDIGADCEFLYDLVRAPIWQATGIDIARSPRDGQRHHLAAGFRQEDFRALCGLPQRHWSTLASGLPPAAAAYLRSAVPADTLILGADLPAWLCQLLDADGRPWLSLGVAAADFGTDRWIAARSNQPALQAHLARHAVTEPELLAQAYLQVAAVRRRRRTAASHAPHGLAGAWDGALVWLGQAEEDPTLIDDQGRFIRAADAAEPIRQALQGRRLVYRPHDLATGDDARQRAHAERERASLAQITGQDVPWCDESLNDLLAMDDDVAFLGLSHPALLQAGWFGKEALMLLRDDADTRPPALWLAPGVVLSEALWAGLLGGEAARQRVTGAEPLPIPGLLRGLMETAAPGAVAPPSTIANAPVALTAAATPAVSAAARFAAAATAAATAATPAATPADSHALDRQRIDELRLEVEGLKEALRVVLRQTAMRSMLDRHPEAAATIPPQAPAASAPTTATMPADPPTAVRHGSPTAPLSTPARWTERRHA